MKKKTATLVTLLITALVASYIAVPAWTYTPAIYGCPEIVDAHFVLDYINAWWHKVVRRYILRQSGPAEDVSINSQEAEQYTTPTTRVVGEPTSIYELVTVINQNTAGYSMQILDYLEENNIPNKSAQIDLFIVPENVYLTFVWTQYTLEIYDGWTDDYGCQIYIVATATSDLVMELYQSRNNVETAKSLLLNAEANGELSYTIKRINPTISEVILYLQVISTLFGIIGWLVWFSKLREKA